MKNIFLMSIKKQAKRYDIAIKVDSDIFNFKITEDLLIECRFLNSRVLSEEEYNNFLSKLVFDSLVFEGMKYAERKERSKKEVKDHLLSLTSSIELADKVINVLEKKNLINDEIYFNNLIEYLIDVKLEGRNKVYEKINELGLNNFYFEYPKEKLASNIKELTIKYNQSSKNMPYNQKIEMAKKFLYSKGYTENEISHYFDRSLITKGDDKKLFERDLEKLKSKYDDKEKIKLALLRKGYSKDLINLI